MWDIFIITVMCYFIFCIAVDLILRFFGIAKSSRWSFLHSLCNVVVMVYCYQDTWIGWSDPYRAITSPSLDPKALAITVGLHVYHIWIDYHKLTLLDWVHHLSSNMFLSVIGIQYFPYPIWNLGVFYVCGLPGAIDYAMLFGVQQGWIGRMTEKYWNVWLNNWLRMPGILYCAAIIYYGYVSGLIKAPIWSFISGFLAATWNGIYFAERVTINYGRNLQKK